MNEEVIISRDVGFDLERDRERCLRGLALDPDLDSNVPSDAQRVTQIFKNPHFYVGGANPGDIVQGKLCDCWFLSALATMSTTQDLVEQSCVERDEEIGVYGFVFFRDAKWVAVIIDDFLYTSMPKFDELSLKEREIYHNNEANYNNDARRHAKNLHFAKSEAEDPEETWVPLYEKAYAKLHGNYAALNNGYAGEAIEDLTGCGHFSVNGLIGGHAYSVLRAVEYNRKRFVVLRNPWGNLEWNGPWSDGSKEWSADWLPALKTLKHSFGVDGQFVMEYKDFLEKWETIDRTLLFDPSWIMSSEWLRVRPRFCLEWSYGDVSFTISLSKASPIIIVLSRLDDRYFKELANPRWTFDFLVFKRGEKKHVAASSSAVFLTQRSVNAELEQLQAGEYIVHVRLDDQSPVTVLFQSEPMDTSQDDTSSGDNISQSTVSNSLTLHPSRIYHHVLAEKLRSQMTASNFKQSAASKYLSTPLDTLAGKDLSELGDDDQDSGNSATTSDENPGNDASRVEADGDVLDGHDDGVMVPEFLEHEKENTIVLGLRVYTHQTSHVEIKGQWRH
ncbi:hypothetical protein C0995_003947 [Termitomyces sp. Mi166|nr:hypothetical protein C0995_003947 [Termitomyces sp. Mi166\